jgi:hypothetical protein
MQRLERAARYDRLGVNQAVLELRDAAYDRKRLVAPQQFLQAARAHRRATKLTCTWPGSEPLGWLEAFRAS